METESRPLSRGWEEWKRTAGGFVASVADLLSIRVAMARQEAKAWSRALLLRLAMVGAALLLVVLSLALLVSGLVVLLERWTGSLLAAIFILFGVCLVVAAALVFTASRIASRPMLEATLREVKKDLDDFTGETE